MSLPEISVLIQTVAPYLIGLAVSCIVIWLARKILRWIFLIKAPSVCLQITPPLHADKSALATEKLFIALHGMLQSASLKDRILMRKPLLSAEIISTKMQGVRYLIRIPKSYKAVVEQLLIGYLATAKVQEIADPLPSTPPFKLLRFTQKLHYAYPLQDAEALYDTDPAGYISNALSRLQADETVSVHFIFSPVHKQEVTSLRAKIRRNENILPRLHKSPLQTVAAFGWLSSLLFGLADLLASGVYGQSKTQYHGAQKELAYEKQVAKGTKPVRTLSYFEHEYVSSIHAKLQQPLFSTTVQAVVSSPDKSIIRGRRRMLLSAFNLYSVTGLQGLRGRAVRLLPKKLQALIIAHRLPAGSQQCVLSTAELAALYHFPDSRSSQTDNLSSSLSRTLNVPVSMKDTKGLDVLYGVNKHHGISTPIGVTAAERQRHTYIVGGTGNGKTTMLLYAIVQDMQSGKGLTVLDPHGDLAETILKHVPAERISDVIYFNPDDLEYPIGINLLELTPGLTGDDLLREKDLITESVISVLRKVFSDDDTGGHRIEYVLRNTIQTALTIEGATLFTIFRLLNDNKYRRSIVRKLDDQDLKNFWNNEIGKAGEFQKVKMAAGITAKIGRFLFSASARKVLEQEKSTIDFADVLDNHKILICNFSKGLLGEDTSALFGTTTLAKIQVAALRRARQDQTKRMDHYLYVDEFQNFATLSFVQMLSEARKYRLFLTLAEQSTAQQNESRLVDIILANVGTVICFRTGSPADELRLLPLFKPFITEGELANLPAYNFYCRVAAVNALEPMSGFTVLIQGSLNISQALTIKDLSRKAYGTMVHTSLPATTQPVTDIKNTNRSKRRRRQDNLVPSP